MRRAYLRLGARLLALRESAGKTWEQVSAAGLGSNTTTWRRETGRARISPEIVRRLCEFYGAGVDETRELLDLARQAAEPVRWPEFRVGVPTWYRLYLDLEAAAATVTTWDDSVVPSELQTEAYAWAIWRGAGSPLSDEEIAPRVDLALRRQQYLFTRTPAPKVTVVIGENVLRRIVGGPQVHQAQVRHLRELDASGAADIRFLPFAAGAHPALAGPFRIMESPDGDSVVYLETEVGAHYLQTSEDLTTYRRIARVLGQRARPIQMFT